MSEQLLDSLMEKVTWRSAIDIALQEGASDIFGLRDYFVEVKGDGESFDNNKITLTLPGVRLKNTRKEIRIAFQSTTKTPEIKAHDEFKVAIIVDDNLLTTIEKAPGDVATYEPIASTMKPDELVEARVINTLLNEYSQALEKMAEEQGSISVIST